MVTVKDILLDYNVPHVGAEHHHGRPGWVSVDCPYCGKGSGKYHLGISLTTGASACWRCGRKNTAAVLALLTGKPAPVMRGRLDRVGYEAPPERKTGTYSAPVGVGDMLPGHKAYLRGRGYDPATVARLWGAKGIGQTNHLSWRIFIPIMHHGQPVSWTTRSIKPHEKQRYISAPAEKEALSHKSILYGADYARHAIIIHEGPLDVWATGPGAVATCGTAYTEAQVLAMSKYSVRVVCFDAEPVAQKRARVLADMLSGIGNRPTYNVVLETGKDTGEADPAEVAELRKTYLG